VVPGAAQDPEVDRPDHISEDALREHLFFLADDARAGRDTLSPGIDVAAHYIADRFSEAGLVPLPGSDNFFAPYPLETGGFDEAGSNVTLGGVPLLAGVDYRPFRFSDTATVTSDVIFVGYGITAPEFSYDDYAGLDVAGKLVLLLRHAPPDAPEREFSGSEHSFFSTKADNAIKHGAAGMILVSDPRATRSPDDLRWPRGLRIPRPADDGDGNDDTEPAEEEPFVAVHASMSAIDAMLGADWTVATLQSAVDGGGSPGEIAVSVPGVVTVAGHEAPSIVTAKNVVGFLPGSDPGLTDEWVVVGAHYDHLGAFESNEDTIYNGADDNASGTSGVLELARHFGRTGSKRSMVFIGFSGEERGLLGSRSLVRGRSDAISPSEHTVIDTGRVRFMLNLDMIGRNPERPVDVYGDGFVPGSKDIVERANAGVRTALNYQGQSYISASDHHPFLMSGVPVMFFFTGLHRDYHDIGDEAGLIAFGRMDDIVEISVGVLSAVASGGFSPELVLPGDRNGLRTSLEETASAVSTQRMHCSHDAVE